MVESNNLKYIGGLFVLIVIIYFVLNNSTNKSSFNNVLSGGPIDELIPINFKKLQNKSNNKFNKLEEQETLSNKYEGYVNTPQNISLVEPDLPEEKGFPIYGKGASMDVRDSNILNKIDDNVLHTGFLKNESIGESTFSDKYGSRILKINSVGIQDNFKPVDEAEKKFFSASYDNFEKKLTQTGFDFLNDKDDFINYDDSFNPSNNIKIEASPGTFTESDKCENTLPRTIKGDQGACYTEGDIPYDSIINGKVNPRLVSRWQSYTGDYDPQDVLNYTKSGVLYPTI